VIFCNGLNFAPNVQAKIVDTISECSRVGTFILCNFRFSRRPNIMNFRDGKIFNALDQFVAGSNVSEWNLYLVLPWKIKPKFRASPCALGWIVEAFRVWEDLKKKNQQCTCAIIKEKVLLPLSNSMKCEICRYYWGENTKEDAKLPQRTRRRDK